MITPPLLKQGDTIGLVSTARKVSETEIENAKKILKNLGFKVKESRFLYECDHQFAGTDDQRASGLQEMLLDEEVKAIICARGGYGTVRIIDKVDFSCLTRDPKWIVGFSDVTVIHSHLPRHYHVETIHGPMLNTFPSAENNNKSIEYLYDILTGNIPLYRFEIHSFNKHGNAEGVITGGNLSVIYSLMGSPSDIDTTGKILFLEDLDEYLYHVDRMMMNLKRAGKLEQLAALVIGGMDDMNDNQIPFGRSAYEIIRDTVSEYDYPVAYGFPAGHGRNNFPLIMGRKAAIQVHADSSELSFCNP